MDFKIHNKAQKEFASEGLGSYSSARRGNGGIGRRVRLRGVWSNPCQFDSGFPHQATRGSGAIRSLFSSLVQEPLHVRLDRLEAFLGQVMLDEAGVLARVLLVDAQGQKRLL